MCYTENIKIIITNKYKIGYVMTFIPIERLPKSATQALARLNQAGFEAFIVGGWIRDELLGMINHDVDIATNAQPFETMRVFAHYAHSRVGEKHGTIGVKIDHDWIEITSYRHDGLSLNARHPKDVQFVNSLKEDLIRRDFTVNALAMDQEGKIIDWVSGLDDLKAKRLRCVGDPEERFKEDALRILRGLRFVARLNFKLDPETAEAMKAMRSLLDTLAVERIYMELQGIFEAPFSALCFQFGAAVMHQILPDLKDLSQERYAPLNQLTSVSSCMVYLYAHLSCACLSSRLHQLKAPKEVIKEASALHALIHTDFENLVQLKRMIGMHSAKRVEEALVLQDLIYHKVNATKQISLIRKWLLEGTCFSVRDLAITGHDLLSLGITGKSIQMCLERVLDEVLHERLSNQKEDLLNFVKHTLA